MANTLWCGGEHSKLYIQLGDFESSLVDSEDVSGINYPNGISNTINDTLWCSDADFYRMSGKITSTIKSSQDMSSVSGAFVDLATDVDFNVVAASAGTNKFYKFSGIFSTTIKTSLGVSWGIETGISSDENYDTFYCDRTVDKLFYLSGQFTSTVKSSLSVAGLGETNPSGISTDGVDTFMTGYTSDQLRRYSGKITSTLKDNQSVAGTDNTPTSIESDDLAGRLGLWLPPTGLTATPGYDLVTINFNTVVGADSYNLYWSTSSPVTIESGTKIAGITDGYVWNLPESETRGDTFYFVVTAYNAVDGESDESDEANAATFLWDFELKQDLVETINDILVSSTGIIVVATSGGVWRSTDNGENFSKVSSLDSTECNSLANSGTYLWAGTNGGRLYRSDQTAASWSQPYVNGWRIDCGGDAINKLLASGSTIYIIGDMQGGVYCNIFSTTDGTSFTEINPSEGDDGDPGFLNFGAGASARSAVFIGSTLYAIRTDTFMRSWSGSAWSDFTAPSVSGKLFVSGSTLYLLSVSTPYVYYYSSGWQILTGGAVPLSSAVNYALFNVGELWIAADSSNGKVYITDTNGSAYQDVGEFSGETEMRALAVDTTNALIVIGGDSSIYLAPLPPPGAPILISVEGGVEQTTETFSTVLSALSYNLYWDTSSGVTTEDNKIEGVTSPYIHNTMLEFGIPYYYRVTAVGYGGESGLSNELYATPTSDVPQIPDIPEPPTASVIFEQPLNKLMSNVNIKYIFDTEMTRMCDAKFFRRPKLLRPLREVSYKVSVFGSSVWTAYIAADNRARNLIRIPLWAFYELLLNDASSGTNSVDVNDDTEFEVGGYVMLMKMDTGEWELLIVQSLVDDTITFTTNLVDSYYATKTVVVPVMEGLGKISKIETVARFGSSIYEVSCIENVSSTGAISVVADQTYTQRPDEVRISGGVDQDKKNIGKELGVIEFTLYNNDRAPYIHSLEYGLKITEFRTLREKFFKCRGREQSLYVPTWRGELSLYEAVSAGVAIIKVTPVGYYSIWETYFKILLDNGVVSEIMTVQSAVDQTTYIELTLTSSITGNYSLGTRIHLVPEVYFLSDELELEFKGKDICLSDVSFIEEII